MMELLIPYRKTFRRDYSFVVKYTIYLIDEVGFGRQMLPIQHYRCDFGYAEEIDSYPQVNGIIKVNGFRLNMIHPEFLDNNGLPLEKGIRADKQGIAAMWVLDDKQIPYHKEKMTVGTKGYFMEAAHKVGECEVIELNW